MPNVVVGARTDVGHHRSHNEDAMLAGERVWAVADGMGGHAAGDVASSLAIAALSELDYPDTQGPAAVNAAVARANAAILHHAAVNPETLGLGTTVTGLMEVTVGGVAHWAVFNVGDSRVYRYAGGDLRRITVDHSEVEELVAQGFIDAEQARTHPARHIITRSVGMRPAPSVDVWVLPQTPGERFLLCSDGLTSELTDAHIASLLTENPDPQTAASALVEAVLDAGARDNVTVVVVDVVAAEQGAGEEITIPRNVWATGAALQSAAVQASDGVQNDGVPDAGVPNDGVPDDDVQNDGVPDDAAREEDQR